ncbi:MAG: 1-acyl-sn-glycerol-3-phosphate acyltransferase [Spirochaetes bacterium]|nr:1-acyl-sn-glycerol-3-phosphate acyltransferase [Spirochaetota bacterium]
MSFIENSKGVGLQERFSDEITEMLKNSDLDTNRVVSADNVYQKKRKINRPYLYKMVESLLLEGSHIEGFENLKYLADLSTKGKSCLVLPAHLSNFDVPVFGNLMKKVGPEYDDIFERIIFIAGRKLNEEHPIIKTFTEMFSRIVISPKTMYENLPEGEEKDRITNESKLINLAAHRKIKELKYKGSMFLVYPTGTRLRAWDNDSGRGLREVDSYLRSFDYFIVGATKGNVLLPDKLRMAEEIPVSDRVVMRFGKVYDSKIFRKTCFKEIAENYHKANLPDKKQYIVNKIMDIMANLLEEIG